MSTTFLNGLKREFNYTETENGAVAYKSTLNACLDAFSLLGIMHKCSEAEICRIFDKALAEDPRMAMRLVFYVRDVRGGQGARRVFRTIMTHLAMDVDKLSLVENNLVNFPKYGRWDDLLCLLETPAKESVIALLARQYSEDMNSLYKWKINEVSLLGKWLPSENASSAQTRKYAKIIIKEFNISSRQYRKSLSLLRQAIDVVERRMSQGDWEGIDFEEVPSKAALRYRNAFLRNLPEKYTAYLGDIATGRAKVNAATLFPVDIVKQIWQILRKRNKNDAEIKLYDAMWKALPDYYEGKEETGICVVDTSGSMYDGISLEVALSLGLYCADKCKGPFKNHFITFSSHPELQEIYGNNIYEKVANMSRANWGMDTNIEAVFKLLLDTALKNHCTQEEIPSKIYIISDMQFNPWWMRGGSRNQTLFEEIRREWNFMGYELPSIVYWNVRASDKGMFQQTCSGFNCCMVGGYSASLFRDVINGTIVEIDEKGKKRERLDPMTVMYKTLMNERYDSVWGG